MPLELVTKGPKETKSVGEKLSLYLKSPDVLALIGELGTGKTTFVKGIAKGLGVKSNYVNSPSFVLVKEYRGKMPLYHLDFYRIENFLEIYNAGWEEYLFREGIKVVEWADRIEKILPHSYLRIELYFRNRNKRLLKLIAKGRRFQRLIGKLKREL